MLPRPTDLLHTSVVISELPAMRRMPAPTPLPTLPGTSWVAQIGAWLAARHEMPRVPRRSAQVLLLRA